MGDAADEALKMIESLTVDGLSDAEAISAVEHCLSPEEAIQKWSVEHSRKAKKLRKQTHA